MSEIKVMTVIGTRPEAIKMLPVIKAIEQDNRFESVTVLTAQHREMLDQVIQQFELKIDYDLNVMKENQGLSTLTNRIMNEVEAVMNKEKPDIVFVHGDTTTTFATSVSAFYQKIPIGHVEAGLRTYDKYSPFPEEANRQITDVLSDLYFVPTVNSQQNLVRENHNIEQIYVTGNTVIDALEYTIKEDYTNPILDKIDEKQKLILLTMHRRENHGEPMRNVFYAIRELVERRTDVDVIFPVHLNPNVRKIAYSILENVDRVHLIEPLDVLDFHNIASKSYLILTDSGGIQEEAPSLGVPVLVLRNETERPEGVETGALKLVGTEKENVTYWLERLLAEEATYLKMSGNPNPYGDGKASKKILEATYHYFNT